MRTILALILMSLVVSAHASVVAVRLSGKLGGFTDPDSLLPFGSIEVGQSDFVLDFDLNLDSQDTIPSLPEIGQYIDAASEVLLTGNNVPLSYSSMLILVLNDVNVADSTDKADAMIFNAGEPVSESNEVGFTLLLSNQEPTRPLPPLVSDQLLVPFLGPDWDFVIVSGGISIGEGENRESLADFFFYPDTITVIPIPAAVWLFASALGLLGWFKRRGSVQ